MILKTKHVSIFLFMFISLLAATLQAQDFQRIKGQVISDGEKAPLAGVLLRAEGAKAVYSDEEGYFDIKVPSAVTMLFVEYLGYEPAIIELDPVMSDSGIRPVGKISLVEKTTHLKEVRVSAGQLPYRNSFEGTNYYISPKLMHDIQPISTEEALKMLPGVNVLGDMGLSNRLNVSIRGSWGRRSEKVLMMEDGSPISPAPYTAPGIYYNPISDRIDAVEVYTGADILRYGPNNMFGIINYITPKPPQQPSLRAKISGGQRGYFTGLLSYGGTWNKVGSQIEAVYKRFDGFMKNSSVEMINLNAKIFAELAENQSLYFKISGQFEDNQATLSSMTPYTFSIDPAEHPFDADRFTMHRYGLDIIHKWLPSADMSLSTKIFASDFARDWWRQNNTVIPAANVRAYVGESIFSERYAYLDGRTFGPEDYVRVGRITNGRESTTDSRWHFTVAGIEETFEKEWKSDTWSNKLEVQAKLYAEAYKDRVLAADSSRWARSGRFTTDLAYRLQSFSGYIRDQFRWNAFQLTPIVRIERVWMQREDRLSLALKPDLPSDNGLEQLNTYTIVQPGVTLGYQTEQLKVFGSVYRGYIAPSKYFAFLVERDGVLVNPLPAETLSNITPEVSLNAELGVRGEILKGRLGGQVAYFTNRISHFYLAGWNEFFDKLAEVRIQGIEAALRLECLPALSDHKLSIQPNITFLRSRVLSGELHDRHLFTQVVHSQATKEEFIQKVNGHPQGYNVYVRNAEGKDVLLDRPVTIEDLGMISKTVYHFGDGGIEDGESPYSPPVSFFLNVFYSYKRFTAGFGLNMVARQYGEFANFENESADGAVGIIPGYRTFDVNFNYDFIVGTTRATLYAGGKNLGDNIFIASRLNRGQSGIMPGGFRQINAGLNLVF